MKKFLALLLSIVMLLPAAVVPAEAASPSWIMEGIYIIRSALDENMVLDISDGSKAAGANLQLYRSNGTTAQMFWIERLGNSRYSITALNSGMVLDVQDGRQVSRANVQQYTSNGTAAQKWHFYSAGSGYYYIASEGELALDASGGVAKNKTNVQIYKPNSTRAQAWKLDRIATPSSYAGTSEFGSSTCAVVRISDKLINKRGKQNATVKLRVYNSAGKACDEKVVVTLKDMEGRIIWQGEKRGGDTLKLGDDNACYKVYVAIERSGTGEIVNDVGIFGNNFMYSSYKGWKLESAKNCRLYSM